MKQRKILKLLIFGMVFMLFSCVNDEVINKMEHVHNSKTKIVSIDKVPIILTSIQRFNKNYRLVSKEDLTNNTSSIENLNLDLNHILVYTKINNGYTSYSIPIINSIPNGQAYYFENLHVIGNNENSFIYRWTPQDKSIPFELKTFTGKLERFDTDNNLNYYDNYINGIKQPRTTQFGKIFKSGENYTDDYQISCTTVVVCGCASQANYCGCDGTYSQCKYAIYNICNSEGGGGGGGTGGGEGGGGTGGGGTGGDGDGDGDGGTGDTGTGPTDPIDQPIDEVVPIVVEEETPCVIITRATNKLQYKTKFNALNKPEKFTAPQETGFALVPNTTGGYYNKDLLAISNRSLKPPIDGINFTHVHNNDVIVDPGTGITYDSNVRILSPADIKTLTDDMLNNNTTNGTFAPSDSFAIMISNEGIFAVVPNVNNITILKKDYDNFQRQYYKRTLDILLTKHALYNTAEKRKKALEKMFLQLIDQTPGYKGNLDLFEGNASDPNNLKWTKKSLNTNNANIVDETPC